MLYDRKVLPKNFYAATSLATILLNLRILSFLQISIITSFIIKKGSKQNGCYQGLLVGHQSFVAIQ